MGILSHKNIKRILVVTLTNLGDVVITLPVIAAVRAAFPHAEVGVVVGPRAYDMLADNPHFKEVVIYDKNATLMEKLRFIQHLRKQRYDFVIDFRNSMIPYLLGKPSHSMKMNHAMRKILSRYDRIPCVLSVLGISPASHQYLPLYEKKVLEGLLLKLRSKGIFAARNILVVSPGARLPLKRWYSEYFAETLDRLTEFYQVPAVLVGDSDDIPVAEEVMAQVKKAEVVSLTGKLTQKELCALVEKAAVVLSNDSAVMHIAHFYDRPVVAFFGPTNPHKYGKSSPQSRILQVSQSCRGCEESLCPQQKRCFETVRPDQALQAIKEILGRS